MAGKIFFKDWQLWQQMTFVLAMCIVSVFGLGCGKLWYNNRLMRKQEVIDEERRARYTEMRKAGVPVSSKRGGGGAEIPFGVRAIQGGVEVDGIWISRPATPTTTTTAEQQPKTRMQQQQQQQSVTTLIGTETTVAADADKKGKELALDGSRSTTEQRGSQSDTSTFFQRVTDAESLASSTTASGTTPRQSQFAAPKPVPKRKHPRVVNGLNEETLRRLDGYSPTRTTTYETYVPARNNNNNLRRPSQRSSASSSGDSVESSQPRSGAASARSGSGRTYASSRSSRMMYNAPGPRAPRLDSRPTDTSVARDYSSSKEHRDHYGAGTYTGSGEHSPSLSEQIPTAPGPTFGPGDLHLNNSRSFSRKGNQGFEVLPGELGTSSGSVEEEDGEVQRGLQPRPPPVERNGRSGGGRGMSYTQALRLENAARNF